MTTETPILEGIVRRVEKLERQNRWLRRFGVVVLLFAGAMLVMGQGRAGRIIEAEKFILRDSGGKVRAKMEVTRDSSAGPQLDFLDQNGRSLVHLSGGAFGGMLLLSDELAQKRVQLSAVQMGGALFLNGSALGEGRGTVSLLANPSVASVAVTDQDGFETVVGNQALLVGNAGAKVMHSGASVVLLDKDGKVLWSAP